MQATHQLVKPPLQVQRAKSNFQTHDRVPQGTNGRAVDASQSCTGTLQVGLTVGLCGRRPRFGTRMTARVAEGTEKPKHEWAFNHFPRIFYVGEVNNQTCRFSGKIFEDARFITQKLTYDGDRGPGAIAFKTLMGVRDVCLAALDVLSSECSCFTLPNFLLRSAYNSSVHQRLYNWQGILHGD